MKQEQIVLTGHDLSLKQIEQIALCGAAVSISSEALEAVNAARELIFTLDKRGVAVYGLNTGVGWNKDKKVYAEFYDQYNKNLLRSHMIGVNPECTQEEVRAMMLIRLNGFLCGHTGVSPEIVQYYKGFLNRGVHPIVKKRGSVSEADIGTLSAIGLVMIGEGEAYIDGERMSGAKALEKAGMTPLILGPKDGLGIVSSNAQSSAFAAVTLLEAEHFLELYQQVFCLALEGFNGVMDPFDETVNAARGYQGQMKSAKLCREYLEGSYLMEPCEGRALQDPLSYRCQSAITGAVIDAMEYTKQQLTVEFNSTDDNPCLLPKEDRMCGSPNFEPLSWTLGIEMLSSAFAHMSMMISQQMLRIVDPVFTGLPRFLTPKEGEVIAFGTIQKTFSVLNTENRMYANPSSMDFLSMAGHIEDMASNAALASDKLAHIIDNLYYMMSIELMHAAQAVDLRKPKKLGKATKPLYEAYRSIVLHLERDRNLSEDIQTTYEFLKTYDTKSKEKVI